MKTKFSKFSTRIIFPIINKNKSKNTDTHSDIYTYIHNTRYQKYKCICKKKIFKCLYETAANTPPGGKI